MHVVAADIFDDKLALAKTFRGQILRSMVKMPMPFNRCRRQPAAWHGALVTAVSPKAMEQAYGFLRSKGTMSLVGLPPGFISLPVFDTVLKRITVRGSIVGTRQDLEESLMFAGEGKVASHFSWIRSRTSMTSSTAWKRARSTVVSSWIWRPETHVEVYANKVESGCLAASSCSILSASRRNGGYRSDRQDR